MPSFFIPLVDAARQKEAYHGMAAFVGGVPLPSNERIYSITFRHDGEVWTATVGEKMQGKATAITAGGRTCRAGIAPVVRRDGDRDLRRMHGPVPDRARWRRPQPLEHAYLGARRAERGDVRLSVKPVYRRGALRTRR